MYESANRTIISSDKDLSPISRQASIQINPGLLLVVHLGTISEKFESI